MEFGDILQTLRQRWRSIAVTALAVLAVVGAGTFLVTPQYQSSTRVFIGVQAGESVSDLAQGSNFAERQMSTYREVVTSPLVLEPVAEALGTEEQSDRLAGALTVTVPQGTVVLEISATHPDPVFARDLANAVGARFREVVGDLSPERPDGTEAVRATVLSEAIVATEPSSPNVARNLLFGAVLGLLLGGGLAILRELLDTKVRDETDVAGVTVAGVLARIPRDESAAKSMIFVHEEPRSPRSEAVRRLRTNLQFIDFSERPRSLVVTSSVKGEGKSTTSINLAVSLADAGSRVLLIDADLRRPSVARYLGLEGKVGLTTVLSGRVDIADVLQPWRKSNLDVLTSGQIPPNPSELLGSAAMAKLLAMAESRYDMIVVDSPPVLPVTDAVVLSRHVGGLVIVAGADVLHRGQLRQALESLENVNAQIFGIVLNKVERTARASYYEDYYVQEGAMASSSRRSSRTPRPNYAPKRARRARSRRVKATVSRR